jgi:hypothetical protein
MGRPILSSQHDRLQVPLNAFVQSGISRIEVSRDPSDVEISCTEPLKNGNEAANVIDLQGSRRWNPGLHITFESNETNNSQGSANVDPDPHEMSIIETATLNSMQSGFSATNERTYRSIDLMNRTWQKAKDWPFSSASSKVAR